MIYKETYRDLVHGTDIKSAENIKSNRFEIKGTSDGWCGKGIYFYDIKKKAWWDANRKCEEIKKRTKKKIKPTIIFADIIDLEVGKILDLRRFKDLCDFEKGIQKLFKNYSLQINNNNIEHSEEVIKLRAMLINYYADKNNKKLIIGNFKQRPQPLYENAINFSNNLDLVFGIETIYCVKDKNIIQNIRQGGGKIK